MAGNSRKGGENREELGIRPARKFQKFVEYDFSKMTDTKGGFLSTDDDPHSTLAALELQDKPAHMSLEDWSKHQLRLKLMREKTGPFEPGLNALDGGMDASKTCFDCGSWEIDWKWLEVFGCRVCSKCKDDKPEKYSLLTKTECRQDYLLTDRKAL
jgi:DNA-repair protein complementing XP-A cells